MFSLGKEPICGLKFCSFPSSPSQHVVVITTTHFIYQLIGNVVETNQEKITFQSLFLNYIDEEGFVNCTFFFLFYL